MPGFVPTRQSASPGAPLILQNDLSRGAKLGIAHDVCTEQHKYGPFAPIRAALERLKAEKPGGPLPRR